MPGVMSLVTPGLTHLSEAGPMVTAGVNIIMTGAHKTMITHQPPTLSEINGHSVTRGWQPITAGKMESLTNQRPAAT